MSVTTIEGIIEGYRGTKYNRRITFARPLRAVQQHRPQENGQAVTMMRTTVSTQPQIIIVVCCITLRRNAYDMEALRLCVYRRTVQ